MPCDPLVLRQRFETAGQEHVFRHWESLDAPARARLLDQLESVDLQLVERFARGEISESPDPGSIEPAPVLGLDAEPADGSREEARQQGDALLRAGKIGIFLVAGGQGSRLGFDGPKGCFALGALSGRTLFEIHAGKIARLRARYRVSIPWYILTSPANDEATRAYFEANAFFGLPREDVLFLPQAMLPAIGDDGKLILATRGELFLSPNGNGGAYEAFVRGALADAEARGIEHLYYFQVDNPLATVADPEYLGLHAIADADVSLRTVEKVSPEERIGVVALRDGRPGIVEYTEISEEQARRTRNGQLVFGAGNIGVHVFRLEFIRAVGRGEIQLPFHLARKSIPSVDAKGEPIEVAGVKLEMFIFDSLPFARRWLAVAARREREFAPVKNPDGVDSPASARKLLIAEHRRWLAECGIEASGDVEIAPDIALDAEDLREQIGTQRGRCFDRDLRVERNEAGEIELLDAASAR